MKRWKNNFPSWSFKVIAQDLDPIFVFIMKGHDFSWISSWSRIKTTHILQLLELRCLREAVKTFEVILSVLEEAIEKSLRRLELIG